MRCSAAIPQPGAGGAGSEAVSAARKLRRSVTVLEERLNYHQRRLDLINGSETFSKTCKSPIGSRSLHA